jgi:anti-sigma regulatory factor (Ser/Thr protein kinase)
MFTLEMENGAITCNLTSEPPLVELFAHLLNDILLYNHVPATNKLTLVARELLKNAVIHGNQGKAERNVNFHLERLSGSEFMLIVRDEGVGFDYEHLDMVLPMDVRHMSKRGYAIIREAVERIEFREHGSQVTVYMSAGEQQ